METQQRSPEEFNDALLSFVEGAQKIVDEHHEGFWSTPELLAQQRETLEINPKSRRYVGIFAKRGCEERAGRIYAFVDTTNGDVLKPATWRAPAKHARGNIFAADNGLGCMDHFGPSYLR